MSEQSNFSFREITCPVCEGNEPRFCGWRGGEAHQNGAGVKTAIVRCSLCSHLYPNPMPYPTGGLSEIYLDAESYFARHDVEKKKRNGLGLFAEFERRLGRKGRSLDVGCGVGELLWAAKECGWECEGIDPSPEFIDIGRAKLGVEGRVATLEEAGFPDGYFDVVIMSGIIEHLYNPCETLRESRRVLRDGGWLWLDAPNEDGLYMKLGNVYMRMLGRDWVVTLAPTFPPYHVQGFNPRSFRKLVERTGFRIEEMEIFGDISPQTGAPTLRKRLEFNAARLVNFMGKLFGQGMYMNVWAQKV